MGTKGDKLSNKAESAATFLVDSISSIGNITSKKMFGGYGIFHSDKMFGIVDSSGGCYLKADDSNRMAFETTGSVKHGRMPYFSIPVNIIDNKDELISWAKKSIEIVK